MEDIDDIEAEQITWWRKNVSNVEKLMSDNEKVFYGAIFEAACWQQGFKDAPYEFRLAAEMGSMTMWSFDEHFEFDPRMFYAITCSYDDEGHIIYWEYRKEGLEQKGWYDIVLTIYCTEGSVEGGPPDDLPWRPDVEEFVKDFKGMRVNVSSS